MKCSGGKNLKGKKRRESEYDDKTVHRLRDRSGVEGREKLKKREKETFEVYIYLHINLCVCYGLLKLLGSSENHPIQKRKTSTGTQDLFNRQWENKARTGLEG